jgi:putative transposase
LGRDQIADGVEPYPLDIWQWGLAQRAGHLRQVSPNIVRMNLLPQKMASVSRRGILFEGLHYTCELAQQEQWFVKARRRWKVPVVYDPRCTDRIYLRLEHGQGLEPCYLLERDAVFKEHSWYDVLDYRRRKNVAAEVAQTRQQQATATFHAQIDHIVQDGVEQTDTVRQGKSVNKNHIRSTRQREREVERQNNRWLWEDKESGESLSESDVYVSPPQPFDHLRQIRDERHKPDES